jgi:nuclear cap-binding protein subunit 2
MKHSTFRLQEKNPRFREKGDSDEEEDDYDGKRRR